MRKTEERDREKSEVRIENGYHRQRSTERKEGRAIYVLKRGERSGTESAGMSTVVVLGEKKVEVNERGKRSIYGYSLCRKVCVKRYRSKSVAKGGLFS